MILRERMQENFSRAAAAYDARADLQQELMHRTLAKGRELFGPGARVLDIGAGTGLLASHAPEWNMLSLDMAQGMCAIAKTRCAQVLQADAAHLPVRDAALDGVISSLCLQWVNEKARSFVEIARVLKPGAHAVVMTLGEHTLRELRSMAAMQLLPMATQDEYVLWARRAGLEVLSCDSAQQVRHYSNLTGLLHSMRAIGAGHAFAYSPVRMGASLFRSLNATYEKKFGNRATWQPVLMVLKKPA